MKTIATSIYQFDELSDAAKEKARDGFRQFVFSELYDYDPVIDDAKKCGQIIGIEINKVYFSGFSSQGNGANFEGSYKYQKGSAKIIKQHAPQDAELHRITDGLQEVQRQNFYRLTASCNHRGQYYHSGCMLINVEDYENPYKNIKDAEDRVIELLRDFANWIYNQLEAEYDYQMSDESVDENIRISGYEFNENGQLA